MVEPGSLKAFLTFLLATDGKTSDNACVDPSLTPGHIRMWLVHRCALKARIDVAAAAAVVVTIQGSTEFARLAATRARADVCLDQC
jgi:hypothetical protein